MLEWTGKIAGGAVFVIVAAIIVLTGSSAFLTKSNPELARVLNPLNTEAKINALSAALVGKKPSAEKLEKMAVEAQSLIDQSPSDGRSYSLLGEIRFRQNRAEDADKLFVKTLSHAPTEVNALVHRINTTLKKDEIDTAVNYMDILLRRWPETIERVKPVAAFLIRNPSAAQLLSDLLIKDPPWRGKMVAVLSDDPNGLAFLQKLVLREKAVGKKIELATISRIINKLMRSKRTLTAFRTFILTLTKTERQALGFVFNANFQLPPDSRPFNWHVNENGEADVDFLKKRSEKSPGGLSVRFREVPAKLGNIQQFLLVPPGRYQLSVRVTARQLAVPKKLFWQLYCIDGSGVPARLEIPEGTYVNQAFSTQFVVPSGKCPLQLLRLKTDLNTSSWSARYHGNVVFHSLIASKIRNTQNAEQTSQ